MIQFRGHILNGGYDVHNGKDNAAPTTCAFYLFIRVMEITDILSQNVPLEDVQYLAGRSNPSGHTVL